MDILGNGLVIYRRQQPVVAAKVGVPGAPQPPAGGGPPGPQTGDINLSNIVKLIPGDMVAIYLAGRGLTVADIAGRSWVFWLVCLCLIACFVLRFFLTRRATGRVNWMLVIVTTIAFFVWAHAVSDVGPIIKEFAGSPAGVVAMIIGALAPVVVPAEPQP